MPSPLGIDFGRNCGCASVTVRPETWLYSQNPCFDRQPPALYNLFEGSRSG